MIKSKIIYLILLACMVLFYILFVDSMSLLILILTVVFPFLQLFILRRISKNITAVLRGQDLSDLIFDTVITGKICKKI